MLKWNLYYFIYRLVNINSNLWALSQALLLCKSTLFKTLNMSNNIPKCSYDFVWNAYCNVVSLLPQSITIVPYCKWAQACPHSPLFQKELQFDICSLISCSLISISLWFVAGSQTWLLFVCFQYFAFLSRDSADIDIQQQIQDKHSNEYEMLAWGLAGSVYVWYSA